MNKTWRIGDLVPENSPAFVKSCYEGVLPYLTDFLTAQHPHRNGVMCPFMPKALGSKNVHFTYFKSSDTDLQLQELIAACVDYYKNREDSTYGALVILLEDNFDMHRLLRAHIDAKHNCIKNELMLGALYKDSQAPSLHSQEYYPLRTPTPILVLRDLTAQDLQFLSPDHYGIYSKIKFLNSFINKFSAQTTKGFTKTKVDEAVSLRRKYLRAILSWCSLITLLIITALWLTLR